MTNAASIEGTDFARRISIITDAGRQLHSRYLTRDEVMNLFEELIALVDSWGHQPEEHLPDNALAQVNMYRVRRAIQITDEPAEVTGASVVEPAAVPVTTEPEPIYWSPWRAIVGRPPVVGDQIRITRPATRLALEVGQIYEVMEVSTQCQNGEYGIRIMIPTRGLDTIFRNYEIVERNDWRPAVGDMFTWRGDDGTDLTIGHRYTITRAWFNVNRDLIVSFRDDVDEGQSWCLHDYPTCMSFEEATTWPDPVQPVAPFEVSPDQRRAFLTLMAEYDERDFILKRARNNGQVVSTMQDDIEHNRRVRIAMGSDE